MALEPFSLQFKTYAQLRAEQDEILNQAERSPDRVTRIVARNKRLLDTAFPSAEEKKALDLEKAAKGAMEEYDAKEWGEGVTDLDKEDVRLDILRRRVGALDPQLAGQIAQQQLIIKSVAYERARTLKQDTLNEESLRAQIDVNKMELNALRRRYDNGGSENIGTFVNPKTGERVDRRPDDPAVDVLLKNGWQFAGTVADIMDAEAVKAKGFKPPKVSDSVIKGLQGIARITDLAQRAGNLLSDPSGKGLDTGWLKDPGGIRSWITRAWGDPVADEKFTQFVMLTDQIRPLFQELAAGNPSDKENEYFNRAAPNPQKSTEFNKAIISDWLDYQRDNLRFQYSAMIANGQSVPPEMLTLADTLGVDLLREGGLGMEELEARQAGRRERLAQLEEAEAARDKPAPGAPAPKPAMTPAERAARLEALRARYEKQAGK